MLGYCRSKGNQLFSRVCLSHRTDKELGQRKGKGNQCGRKESLRGPPPAHTHTESQCGVIWVPQASPEARSVAGLRRCWCGEGSLESRGPDFAYAIRSLPQRTFCG